jgi:hypothetical protein
MKFSGFFCNEIDASVISIDFDEDNDIWDFNIFTWLHFFWLIDIRSIDPHEGKIFTKNNCTIFIILNKKNIWSNQG